MILYATLALCAVFTAVVVYKYDLYDREPWPLLFLCAALGAVAMTAAGRVESLAFRSWPRLGDGAIAFVAAAVEELGKLLVVTAIALLARRQFNDPLDGLIYGSVAGLGAALEESVGVLRGAAHAPLLLPGSEVVRISGHLVMGGIGAFGLGALRLKRPWAWGWLLSSFAAAGALHFLWDWLSLSPAPEQQAVQALRASALMLGGLVVWRRLVTIGLSWSQPVFAPGPSRAGAIVEDREAAR